MIQSFPIEIQHIILSYLGIFKEQNGKYMQQISKKNPIYGLLSKIPKKEVIFVSERYSCSNVHVFFSRHHFLLTLIEDPYRLRYMLYKYGKFIDDTRYICE